MEEKKNNSKGIVYCIIFLIIGGLVGYFITNKFLVNETECMENVVEKVVTETVYSESVLKEETLSDLKGKFIVYDLSVKNINEKYTYNNNTYEIVNSNNKLTINGTKIASTKNGGYVYLLGELVIVNSSGLFVYNLEGEKVNYAFDSEIKKMNSKYIGTPEGNIIQNLEIFEGSVILTFGNSKLSNLDFSYDQDKETITFENKEYTYVQFRDTDYAKLPLQYGVRIPISSVSSVYNSKTNTLTLEVEENIYNYITD